MSDQAAPPPLDVLLARREWVRRFARTLARDDATADDLEQDAWVAAIEHPPRHVEAPTGWLRRVLVRRAIDVGVEGRRRETRERVASRAESMPASADVVAAAEAHRRVVEAVLALDEPYRTTVLLRFFEDLPPREVAARMSVPVETVRSRVKRACEQLRGRLDDEGGGGRAAWLAPLLAVRAPDDVVPAPAGNAAVAGRPLGAYVGAGAALLVAIVLVVAWMRPHERAASRSLAAAAPNRAQPAAVRGPQRGRDGRPRAAEGLATETPAQDDASKAAAPATSAASDPKTPRAFTVYVVDERGAPVVGLRVRIDPEEMADELDAVSDERGRAKFEVVGAVRSARAEARAADGRAWRPRSRLVSVAKTAMSVELVVAPGAWIRGRAEHEDGKPFEWAEIVALDGARSVARAYAGEDGAFEIAVPESGTFDVALTGVSHQVFGTTNGPTGRTTRVMDRGYGPTDGEAGGVAVGTEGIVLTRRVPAGRRAMRVRATTADGRPVAGAAIRVDGGGLQAPPAPTVLPTTDADGRCTVEDVPDCRVSVGLAAGPADPWPWTAVGCMPPVQPLFARPGDAEVTIEFQAATTIAGRVEVPPDMKRRRLDGRPSPARVETWLGDELVSFAWTDADDRFVASIPASSGGPYRLLAAIWSEDGRRYLAETSDVRHGAADVVLRIATNDPPPAPAPAKPFVAAPK
jgi:RNA polymerase sigma-70 factor (ECF subfamily)